MAYALEDRTIARLIDPGSVERGREYELSGNVSSFRWARMDTVLEGFVTGSRSSIYRLNIMFTDVDGQTAPTVGICACPIHVNCKHVAAVLFALRRSLSDQTQQLTAQEPWEQLLSPLVSRPKTEESAPSPLALQLELQPTADLTRIGLQGRPMTMGGKGRWIRGRVNWNNLSYGYSYQDWNPEHHRILSAIYALHSASRRHYGTEQWIRLDDLPGRALWALLDEAELAGVGLVQANTEQSPVLVSRQAVQLTMDLARQPNGIVLRPWLTLGQETLTPESVAFVGDPAHSIAYGAQLNGYTGANTGDQFSLARLDRPLTRNLRVLGAHHGDLVVPVEQESRFLDEYFPALKSSVEISSRDDSFQPPSVARPMLALTVKVLPDNRLDIGWEWLYRRAEDAAGAGSRYRLHGLSVADAFRDKAEEAEILASLDLARYPTLQEKIPTGLRLAQQTMLEGPGTIEFVGTVLPELTDHDWVDITIVGEQVTYRKSNEDPVIEVSTAAVEGDRDWFDLGVTVTIDGEEVAFHELFRALATGDEMMILPSGTYFSLDHPGVQQLAALINEAAELSDAPEGEIRISRFQSALWDEIQELAMVTAQATVWQESVSSLLAGAEIEPVRQPTGLHAHLRGYQQEGLDWLAFLYRHELGGVLADDMGLGKTLQTLALICHVRENPRTQRKKPPFLVVAPTSVVTNWASESERFAPGLRTLAITRTEGKGNYQLAVEAGDVDIVITSYALFRIDFDAYSGLAWAGLILDEAQFVKNYKSRAYQCVRKLDAPFKLAITGTPMENNLMELWSLFSLTAPGLFGTPSQFSEFYRRPIERDGDTERLQRLRRRIRPLMLRRTKEKVASELPAKQEQVMELELLPRHRKIYQTHLQRERKKVLGLIEDLDGNRFAIFRSLTILRQLSLDASLYDAKYAGTPSAKLEALGELLEDIVAEGHRTLIFSQFTGFLAKARELLEATGIDYAYLDGKTRNRGKVIDGFRNGSAPVFLISLKAGGFGLNLTEADYCILLDPWWNPAAEAQAIDRTHRIGQTKKVNVYRLVAKDTIEEKVMALKASKIKLFSSVMDDGGAVGGRLSVADIKELLS